MTLTRPQRAALKLAMEYLKKAEMTAYGDWEIVKRQVNYYERSQINAKEAHYREVVAAIQVIEAMLRGVQTEMKI